MTAPSTEFKIPISTPLGVLNAWAVTYGNPIHPRILLVQGGPGTTHDYLISTAQSLAGQGYSVTMYGPIGTDYSDKAASYEFCGLDWFINELNQVVDYLKTKGAKDIRFLCLLAAPEGVEIMKKNHPDVKVFTASLDRSLNEIGYILPGLGDAGDRLYGTK